MFNLVDELRNPNCVRGLQLVRDEAATEIERLQAENEALIEVLHENGITVDLLALDSQPQRKLEKAIPGDLWLWVRLGYVALVLGHPKQGRKIKGNTWIWLYHHQGRCLKASPSDLRDNDPNASMFQTFRLSGTEELRYVGNIFDLVPLNSLT